MPPVPPTDEAFRLAVIIPHYNDADRLERCLQALAPQLSAVPGVETLVVDNASPESPAAMVARIGGAVGMRCLTETARGAAAARNCGVHASTAPLLAFLDCDCVPAPDWLERCFDAATRGDLVGGRVDTFEETPPPRSGAEAFEAVFAFHQRDYVARKGFSVTANLVTRRDVFLATGDMVPGLSEDMDWCRRATAQGFVLVYDDDLPVSHPTRQDWPALVRKWRRTTDETFLLHGTDPADRLTWVLRAGAVALSGVAHLPRIWTAPALSDTTERWRGSTTLLRLRFCRAGWMLRQAFAGAPLTGRNNG
ncbi:glycosyltransferase family 2 protein (plasmid) [Rhodobacteraceae bacterium SC52]|nr:glycosyltransferase family 2 protein [Rhodobacteraceae bacterium SC52]